MQGTLKELVADLQVGHSCGLLCIDSRLQALMDGHCEWAKARSCGVGGVFDVFVPKKECVRYIMIRIATGFGRSVSCSHKKTQRTLNQAEPEQHRSGSLASLQNGVD